MNWFSGKTKDTPKEVKAGVLNNFPTPEDAKYALENGFAYGKPWGAYAEGKAPQNLMLNPATTAGSLDALFEGFKDPAMRARLIRKVNSPEMETAVTQAALAVNRNPIASLGFDPERVINSIDKQITIAGAYDPNTDQIWASSDHVSTLVHESIHRGLKILRDESSEAQKLMKSLPNEEYVVRYMMYKYAGDPEKGTGDIGDKQRQYGMELMDNKNYPSVTKERLVALDRLMTLASEVLQKRSPAMGPR